LTIVCRLERPCLSQEVRAPPFENHWFNHIRVEKPNVFADASRYKMIKHDREKGNERNPQRVAMIREVARYQDSDGISSLSYLVRI